MKIPAIAMDHNLMWTRTGQVWATWRLNPPIINGKPILYNYATAEVKQAIRDQHQALIQALRGEALILGLAADLDPLSIINRMLAGVDINSSPEWADEVARTLQALRAAPLGERAFWLAVPLRGSVKEQTRWWAQSQEAELRERMGLPKWRPSASAIQMALATARTIEENIPKSFRPSPASSVEQIWIATHLQQAGLAADDTPLPDAGNAERASAQRRDPLEAVVRPRPTYVPAPWTDEGGQSDVSRGQMFAPFRRRYLKVHCPWNTNDEASYQVVQALVGGPRGGWEFPGIEWISFVEQMPFDVDWVIRMRVTPAADVRRRNKRAENELRDQFDQQDGQNQITGGASELGQRAQDLADFHASLNRSDKEVEVEATTLFVTGAHEPELAMRRAQALRDSFKQYEFHLEAPLGGQEELWWAAWPGVPARSKLWEFAQITTGREFATGVPIVGFKLGDATGARMGTNISCGRHAPVLVDRVATLEANLSACFATVAELGAGKSVLMKADMGAMLDRGGRVLAIDRTERREYAEFATAIRPDKKQIVDLLGPTISLDPLRIFPPARAARMVQSLFATMLGVSMRDPRGTKLSSLLQPAYLEEHQIKSLRDMDEHLAKLQGDVAEELSSLMRSVSQSELGEVLFNDALPPLDTSARAIVFLTRGLTLPDERELSTPHLFNEMPPEKVVGRAIYAMLTSLIRSLCFEDPNDIAGAYFDEAYFVTSSPEGVRDLRLLIQDGRKHGAYVGIASHDPEHFGDPVMRGLIPERYVMRQRNRALAKRAVLFLTGEDATEPGEETPEADERLVEVVATDLSPLDVNGEVADGRHGEALMSDRVGLIGKIAKTLPENPERRAAILSTPLVGKKAA